MKRNKTESVSIILPCAGRDARLNLPYPKELIRISEDMSVIDCSFRHILASRVKSRVIVVVGPHKFDTVRYLYEKYNDKIDLVFVFQKNNDNDKDITGVVRSAEHLFGDKNIILMPNAIIECKDKSIPLIDKMLKSLNDRPFVFMSKDESSVSRLKLFGALNIKDGKVIDYEDKPSKNIGKYNAFWVSYGFRKEVFSEISAAIEQSVFKKANFKKAFRKSFLYKSRVVKIDEYTDIGTWTNLNAYLLRQYLVKSGIDPQLLKIR